MALFTVNHLKAALGEALDHITGGTVITGTQYFGEDKTYYINRGIVKVVLPIIFIN